MNGEDIWTKASRLLQDFSPQSIIDAGANQGDMTQRMLAD